jgi:hypothetical protein
LNFMELLGAFGAQKLHKRFSHPLRAGVGVGERYLSLLKPKGHSEKEEPGGD